jgi:hypothetical protein
MEELKGTQEVRALLGAVLPAEVAPRTFEVICMRSGEANGLYYPAEALQRSVQEGLWEGATAFANHASPAAETRPGGRAIEDVVGVLSSAQWTGEAILARLTCSGPKGEMVAQLAREILAAQERGEPAPNIGLSADLIVQRERQSNRIQRIVRVNSVDVVYSPAAGGAFLRALNTGLPQRAHSSQRKRRQSLSPLGEDAKRKGGNSMPNEQATARTEELALEEEGLQLGLALEESRQVLSAQCAYLLQAALQGSDLPQPLKDEVRQEFAGKIFRPEALQQRLEEKRRTWARLLEAQVVRGAGARVSTRDELERIRLATERLFGLSVPEDALSIPRLSGIRELYLLLTGDHEFHGHAHPERVQLANVTTATMANLTADVLNKVMLQAYNRRERWWEPIVTHRDLLRFQEMKMIRAYGFSTLSTVAEGATYTEKTWDDLQETAEIVKKGNYVGVTLEMIMADDLEAVRAIPQLLGSAAWNTVSDAVSAIFTANGGTGPLMSDGEQLFSSAHNNLGTAALDFDSFDAAQVAVMSQTEPGSGRRLGVPARYLLVPVQLRSTGMILRNSINRPGGAQNEVNPWYDDFEVIVVPPWTDPNNWALATDPNVAEHIVLGWLQGQREPEIFTAAEETSGSMFTNDELRIKVRFFICCGVADYRGLYKANVA